MTKIPSRRNIELFLLIFSFIIIFSGYILIDLAAKKLDFYTIGNQVGALFILSLILHIFIRFTAKYADPIILPTVTTINGIGIIIIHRIDNANINNISFDMVGYKQVIFTIAGIILAITTLAILKDHKILRRYTYIAMLASVILLFLPMTPLGITIQGARVWINLGFFTFQPAELAKITLSIFFAGYLVSVQDNLIISGKKILNFQIPHIKHSGPLVLIWLMSIGILASQKDIGTSMIIFFIFIVIIYTATGKKSWLILGLILASITVLLASKIFLHVEQRFTIWRKALDQDIYDAPGGSYQVVQGLFGLAHGGLFGTGLGKGFPHITPYANSDFIITSVGEELGLFGLSAVLILFLILIERGMRTAIGVRDNFGKLLALGLTFSVVIQCFIVVGGVTKLIPLSGITTPFMSAGGSSLVANWIIVAILLRISDAARRPENKVHTGKLDIVTLSESPSIFISDEKNSKEYENVNTMFIDKEGDIK